MTDHPFDGRHCYALINPKINSIVKTTDPLPPHAFHPLTDQQSSTVH